ncbi:MAG: hypothetical protein WC091_18995 [Sulfuricellaceae bacterium]
MNTSHRPITAPARAGKTATARNTVLRRSALAVAVAAAFSLPAALPVGSLAATALVALAALPQVAQADWERLEGGAGAGSVALFNGGYISFAIAPTGSPEAGKPYVAYTNTGDMSNKTSVMKFNGANWVAVGSAEFSAGGAEYISLAIAPDGTPYVAYIDSEHLISG